MRKKTPPKMVTEDKRPSKLAVLIKRKSKQSSRMHKIMIQNTRPFNNMSPCETITLEVGMEFRNMCGGGEVTSSIEFGWHCTFA